MQEVVEKLHCPGLLGSAAVGVIHNIAVGVIPSLTSTDLVGPSLPGGRSQSSIAILQRRLGKVTREPQLPASCCVTHTG